MPIVNACLGGLANAIPAGQAKLNMTWITNDGENQQVTFVISGTTSKSVQSDANGYASVQLPVGDYTVSVTHDGEYIGDDPKSITLTSRGVGTLTWLTGARNAQVVTFASPGSMDSSSVSYTITQGGTSVSSGSSWNATMTFNLYGGTYLLTVNAYGDSFTHEFTVPKNTGITQDLSDKFCKLTVSSNYSLRSITIRGYSVSGTSSYASSHSAYMIRSSKSASIGGTVNTPTPPSYSGASTAYLYTFSVSSTSVTPNSASKSASIPVSKVTNLVFITSDGTLTVPSGSYNVLINGGGGGCREDDIRYNGGASGGEIMMYSGALSGSYDITLGTGSTYSGSASSFGTLLSANGGSESAFTTVGVAGGSGGRGFADGEFEGLNGKSTSGDIGGGSGGSGGATGSSTSTEKYSQGGSGGTKFGGSGGGGSTKSYGKNGENGTSISVGGKYFSAEGGNGGAEYVYHSTAYIGGGGGGGGGYGANGGCGSKGLFVEDSSGWWRYSGAGGGGGGALGGAGGDAKPGRSDGGEHGRGYGGGAGGYGKDRYAAGGGGGGIGSTTVESSSSSKGANGCAVIWWVS